MGLKEKPVETVAAFFVSWRCPVREPAQEGLASPEHQQGWDKLIDYHRAAGTRPSIVKCLQREHRLSTRELPKA